MRARYMFGVLREALRRFNDDDHAVYAGHMAFTLLLSFGPFIVCAILFAKMVDPDAALHLIALFKVLELNGILPKAIADLFVTVVDTVAPQADIAADAMSRSGDLTVVAISALIGLYAGSSAFEAARNGFNEAYDVRERRNVVFRRFQSHLLALSLALLFALVSLGFVTITISFNALDEIRILLAGYGVSGAVWGAILLVLAGGLVALLFFTLLLGIHMTLPRGYVRRWSLYVWAQDEIEDVRAVRVPILPGVRWTAVLWILFAIGFSSILGSLVSLEGNHGALAGVVATLLFFYISAAVIFFGAQINIAIATIGEDGRPKWPHPALPRRPDFDETEIEAYRVLTAARPEGRIKRLLFYCVGGGVCDPEAETRRLAAQEAARKAAGPVAGEDAEATTSRGAAGARAERDAVA